MFGWVGLITTAVEGIKKLNELLNASSPESQKIIGQQGFSMNSNASPSAGGSNMTFSTPKKTTTPAKSTVINLNVKTVNDAKTTINEVKRFQNATGTSLGRALMG